MNGIIENFRKRFVPPNDVPKDDHLKATSNFKNGDSPRKSENPKVHLKDPAIQIARIIK